MTRGIRRAEVHAAIDGARVTDALAATARRALVAYRIPADAALRPLRLTNNAVFEVVLRSGERRVLRVHRPHYRTPIHTRSELPFSLRARCRARRDAGRRAASDRCARR